jgi:uncharacterized protein
MNDNFSPKPTSSDCNGNIHHMAVKGVELFNSGQYWKAHEAFEEAWLDETGEVRHLYRGILQVGVTYLHVERRNYYGALKVYHRSKRWLTPYPDICCGIFVRDIKADLEEVIAEVRRLGPDRLDKFDRSLLKPIQYIPHITV